MKNGKTPMRAVIVGAVESTQVAIEAFTRSDWCLALVVTLPPEASGRHSDFVDLADSAVRAGARLHYTRQVNDAETIRAIADARPDYIFVVGWSQICGPDFRAIAPDRTIGYHPAPIPRLRGRAVIPWTILLDEKITAGTLFWIDEGVDSGPILAQQFFLVSPDECAASLYLKHMFVLGSIMDEALRTIASGAPPRRVQDEACATYAARRRPEDGLIDWTASAASIERLVRAVGRPYPGAFTQSQGGRIVIWRSSLVVPNTENRAQPGEIVGIDDLSITVQTGDGLLWIEEWDAEETFRPVLHEILGKPRG